MFLEKKLLFINAKRNFREDLNFAKIDFCRLQTGILHSKTQKSYYHLYKSNKRIQRLLSSSHYSSLDQLAFFSPFISFFLQKIYPRNSKLQSFKANKNSNAVNRINCLKQTACLCKLFHRNFSHSHSIIDFNLNHTNAMWTLIRMHVVFNICSV